MNSAVTYWTQADNICVYIEAISEVWLQMHRYCVVPLHIHMVCACGNKAAVLIINFATELSNFERLFSNDAGTPPYG